MRFQDVTEQSKFAVTPQQDAIQNVNAAPIFNVTPEIFKENKEEWLPELQEFERGPAQASPTVAENIKKDPEIAAAVLPDNEELSLAEKIYHDGLQKIKGVTGRRRKRDDLNFDKMLFGLNEDEEFELEGLNEEAQNNFGDKDYKLSWLEELPGSVAAGLVDFGAVVARNKELVAGMTGGGALLGGTTGLVGGPATGIGGAVAGGVTGFAAGFATAGFWDSFKQMAGSSYGEFGDITDSATGQPMDESTKKSLAIGVGVLGGAVEFASTKLLLKNMPIFKKYLAPKELKIILAKNPALRESILKIAKPMETKIAAALKAGATKEGFLKALFKSGVTEGTEETIQDYIQMVGQGIAETTRDGELDFVEGLRTVSDNIAFDPKTQKNLATSFVVGGLVGSTVHTGLAVVDKGINYVERVRESKKPPVTPPPASPTETKVDPNVEGQQKVELKTPDPVQAATQILELQNVVNEAGERIKGTGIFKQSPQLANQLRKQMLTNAKAPDVYFDVQELEEKFGGDDEKMNKIRRAFNIAPETPNAQRSMPLHKMMELVDSGIDLDVFMRLQPEGPNPKSAEAFAKKKAEDNKRREDMLSKLGAVGEKTPEQRAAEIPLKEMSTEELTLALGSKEVADQYMLKLDAAAEEVKNSRKTPDQKTTLPTPKGTTLYHGTNKEFDKYDHSKSGGLAHFAKEPGTAQMYAGAAGGGRRQDSIQNSWLINHETGVVYELKGDSFVPVGKLPEGETFVSDNLGKLSDKEKQPISKNDFYENHVDEKGHSESFDLQSKNARVVEYDGSGKSILDLKKIEGVQVIAGLTPTNTNEAHVINEAKKALADKQTGFGFWQATKTAKYHSIKGIIEQLRDMGYDGVHFQDDAHETVSFFEPDGTLAAIEHQRRKTELIKETLPDDDGYKGTLKKALDTPFPDENVTNEFDYMNQPVLTQTVEGVLDEKQLAEINGAVKEAKQDVVNKIDEAAKLEMNEIIDETVEEAMQAEILTQIDKLEGSRELKIMEEVEVLTAKGPDFQINPKLLTEEQKAIYENDSAGKGRLKERKVFDKNGQMSADTLAQAVGAKSGDELLVIMSRMPSRVEIAKARAEYVREDIEQDARDSVDLNHTAIEKAYSNKTYNDLRVADFMRLIHWKTKKKLIKLMSLPLRVKALKEQARQAVSQMRVKDLKPKLFMVAQRKSHAIAVKSTLAGDYLKGSTAKEAEALNAQMTIESMKAVGEVNRLKRFVQKLKRKSVRDMLKKAGAWPAVTEILDLWNLNANAKGQSQKNAYANYAQEQVAKGNGSFIIPDELSDLRESLGDMTVEQVRVIHARLRQILHHAKEVTATREGFDAQAQAALDRFATEFAEDMSNHPDFDPDRDITQQGKQTEQGKIRRIFGAGLSPIRNIEHITLWLDKHVVGGKLYKVLIEPMKGRGFFTDRGETYKGKLQAIFTEHMEKLIKAFGIKEWQDMHNTWVYVDEFKDSKHLSGGHLTIYNLFQMLLNMGNESNRERLTRGYMEFDDNGVPTKSISIETIASVLEKHLDKKHFAAAQNIWNMYKTLRKPVRELQLRTKGIEPDFIEGKAFQAHGQMWEGGYYPVITDANMSLDKLKKNAEAVIDANSGETIAHLQNLHFAEDMTRQGYLESRTKNKQPLDLNHSLGVPFELVVHDLAFREVIRDGMAILTNDKIAKAIKRTVGIHNYNVMLNSVVQLGSSVEAENTLLFDSTKGSKWLYSKARSQAQVAVLAYRTMTMIIQFLSPINTLQLMGVRKGKSIGYATGTVFKMLKHSLGKMGKPELSREYLAHAFQQLRTNPLNLSTYYKMAADINPKLGNIMQGIDDNIRDPMQRMMPVQYRKGPESIRAATGLYNKLTDKFSIVTTDIAMGILGQIDLSMKVIFTIAAYRQFMNGDAPGVSLEQVQAMTEQQRHEAASSYSSSVVDLTLTAGSQIDRAQLQKELPSIAVFFNDARNHLNNQMRMGREARWAVQDGRYGDAATAVLVLMITTGLYRLAEDIIRKNETPFSGRSDKGYVRKRFDGRKIVKNPGKFLKDFLWYFATAPIDQFMGNVPLIRDYKYIQDHESPDPRKRKLSAEPFFMKVANDAFLHAPRGVVKKTEEALHYMKLKRANKSFLKLSKREKQAMLFMLMLPTSRGAAVNALVDLFDSTPKATKSLVKELRQAIKSLEAEKPLDKDDAEDLERLKEIESEWPTGQEPQPVDTEVSKEEDES